MYALFTMKQLQQFIPLGVTSIYRLINEGKFPRPRKIGRRAVWIEPEVMEFLEKIREGDGI